MSRLPVIEMFGPTIQGEGAVIGVKTLFVRLYGCDYRCSWCDSAFTWNGTAVGEISRLDTGEIVSRLRELGLDGCRYVTITGGNPALYGQPVEDLIDALHRLDKLVNVETQGSIWQDWLPKVDRLSISPKPPSSGMRPDLERLDGIMSRLDPRKASLKIVIFDETDLAFAKSLHSRYPAFECFLQTGNARVHDSGDISGHLLDRLGWLFQRVIEDDEWRDARVLPQLHALVWHNERGR